MCFDHRFADERRRLAPAVSRGRGVDVHVLPVRIDDLETFSQAVERGADGVVMDGRWMDMDRLCHRR